MLGPFPTFYGPFTAFAKHLLLRLQKVIRFQRGPNVTLLAVYVSFCNTLPLTIWSSYY